MDPLHTFRDVPVTMHAALYELWHARQMPAHHLQRMQHFLANIWSTLIKSIMTIRLIGRPNESHHQLAEAQLENEDIVPMGPHTGLSQFSIGSSETMGRLLLKRSRSKRSSVCPEALIWPKVPEHPNILPFLGTFKLGKNSHEYHVSSYLDGLLPLEAYIRQTPEASRHALVLQLCQALVSLHSAGILHGDVGITNVLVSEGKAILYEFSMSVQQDWGFEKDVLDFGITIAEILNGRRYHHAIFRILRSHPPIKVWTSPLGRCYRTLWDVARWCWNSDSYRRPTMKEVLKDLSGTTQLLQHLQPSLDKVETDPIPSTEPRRTRPFSHPVADRSPTVPRCLTRSRSRTSLPPDGGPKMQCIMLPGCPPLRYRRAQGSPPARGGYSEVWMCEAVGPENCRKLLAEKVLGGVDQLDQLERDGSAVLRKRLKQEVTIWMKLNHRNIAPLMGFTLFPSVTLIAPWYANGNIHGYLRKQPETNRMKLLLEIASGLAYLHEFEPPVVHGDIKPDNILIDDYGSAVINDFGLSRSVGETVSALISSRRGAGNVRWMAPELLDGSIPKSLEGDVYSFACLAFFILTGLIPFKTLSKDPPIVLALCAGHTPVAPSDRSRSLNCRPVPEQWVWPLLDECWEKQPDKRPSMMRIQERLARMYEMSVGSVGQSGGMYEIPEGVESGDEQGSDKAEN